MEKCLSKISIIKQNIWNYGIIVGLKSNKIILPKASEIKLLLTDPRIDLRKKRSFICYYIYWLIKKKINIFINYKRI